MHCASGGRASLRALRFRRLDKLPRCQLAYIYQVMICRSQPSTPFGGSVARIGSVTPLLSAAERAHTPCVCYSHAALFSVFSSLNTSHSLGLECSTTGRQPILSNRLSWWGWFCVWWSVLRRLRVSSVFFLLAIFPSLRF